ncbi:surface-adhesin E family protein [Janthinobacterium sp. NFX145]|uniref:surface-adhesin E family protein n=1 Tax=Janthinobacterium sp. NFX145 TaxID=3415602 RepID=UPI003CC5E571
MRKIIFVLVFVFSSGIVKAEKLRFMLEFGYKEKVFFLDEETIEKKGKMVSVWVKEVSNQKFIRPGEASYRMTLWEANCSKRTIQALSSASFNSSGDGISATNQPGDLMKIVPETRGAEYHKMFCNPNFPEIASLTKPVDNPAELAKTAFKVYEEHAK